MGDILEFLKENKASAAFIAVVVLYILAQVIRFVIENPGVQ